MNSVLHEVLYIVNQPYDSYDLVLQTTLQTFQTIVVINDVANVKLMQKKLFEMAN